MYKILCAENDKMSRMILESFLRKENHIIHVCKDGDDAYDIILANAKHYDLIITDISMPKMDGTLLAFNIKCKLGLTTPIIACTSYKKELFKSNLTINFDGWLVKPLSKKDLDSEIHRVMGCKNNETLKIRRDEYEK